MSTVSEIEAAIAQLPPAQWREIRQWMDAHPPAEEIALSGVDIFRQLQAEAGLTEEAATAWKAAVNDRRR